MSPGSQASIEISCKIEVFGHAYLVHCTKLFNSQGSYFNSLILQALMLLPGRAERAMQRKSKTSTVTIFAAISAFPFPGARTNSTFLPIGFHPQLKIITNAM